MCEPCLNRPETEATCSFAEINGDIRTQKRGRDTRFFVQGLYNGPGLKDDEDGNICDNDNVAAIYERHDKTKASPMYDIWYGNVHSITCLVNKQRCTVHKVHLHDASGEITLKWYRPVLTPAGRHHKHHNKQAFALPVTEEEGFNKTVNRVQLVSAVGMILDEAHSCYLLVAPDQQFVKEQLKNFAAHHKRLAAAKNKAQRSMIGEYMKPIRPNHHGVKQKVLFL